MYPLWKWKCESFSPDSFASPASLLCQWDSPGMNTGVGCYSLLQGIWSTQGSNQGLLHCEWTLNHLTHQGSPIVIKQHFSSSHTALYCPWCLSFYFYIYDFFYLKYLALVDSWNILSFVSGLFPFSYYPQGLSML